jgi:hypothetical protein
MFKSIAGIVIAALALYVWGFVFWGASGLPYTAWKQVVDEPKVVQMLREQFPENGTYSIPGHGGDPESAAASFESGPVAFVHMTARDGRPAMDPSIMVGGFVLSLVMSTLLWGILRMVAIPAYGRRVGLCVMIGLMGTVAIIVGDVVWWQIDAGWKGWQAFYTVASFLVMGLVLAAFTEPEQPL